MGTEHSNDKLTTSQPQPKPSEILGWLVEQVTILAEAIGEAMTPARLKIYAADLADLDRSQLEMAFARGRRECRFFPKIAELRELAGASPKQSQDAEARKAWDVLQTFVSKYVGNDVHGTYGPVHGWHPKTFPQLSDRILDTVRRSGGWKTYKCMTDEDFPFVQKRFFEEFLAWTAVERVDLGHMLTAAVPEPKRLSDGVKIEQRRENKPTEARTSKPKPIPQPLTDAQRRDRREMLRQQAAYVRQREARGQSCALEWTGVGRGSTGD
jgi:hypothetical protein